MSLAFEGRRRLNAPPADLFREASGTRALAKRRIPTFKQPPLRRTATIGRLGVDGPMYADAEAGAGRVRAPIQI